MQFSRAVIASLLLVLTNSCQAESSYRVTYVYDGDTVKIRSGNNEFKLRLTDIDAPERDQAYGLKSRRALAKLCQNKNSTVTATVTGTDKYNRTLGKLQCNQLDASTYLVAHGLAWHYVHYSNDPLLHDAELTARRKKLGLWAGENPTPPWIWRHKQN